MQPNGYGDPGDFLGSDDLDQIIQMSRQDAQPSSSTASSSRTRDPFAVAMELQNKIDSLDAEINSYDDQIERLQATRKLCLDERNALIRERDAQKSGPAMNGNGKGKDVAKGGTDYLQEDFYWTQKLKSELWNVFKIKDFRLCQRGVCNAAMAGRDIVCVMPTGGGKSLTYQLPAVLCPGVTLVISPLISLITDQLMHLQANGIRAVKMTRATLESEKKEITRVFKAMASRIPLQGEQEIKLCYVTPEKIVKSGTFRSLLEKLASGKMLSRIIVDEAHCVSQLGHDFRPDYQQLHILRQMFPHVPITALSATCPPQVLDDLVKTLRLKKVVDGRNAPLSNTGTVYFSAPLYRKNLHYQVLPKPSAAKDAIQTMADYILAKHPGDSGIIYCLKKSDAEDVASGIREASQGKIKTGVYHADKSDREKDGLHRAWHEGVVKVVCATIAFGLGIDKGDVRFVLHQSMSKSLDGFYQESGRAGRDGKDSDCVLYYRSQDFSSLSSMVNMDKEGPPKLRAMLEFAQNLEECRKVQFAKYFSVTSQVAVSSWTTDDSRALERCGHCDNCTRPPESVDRRDVTVEAWQILKVSEELQRSGAQVTLGKLADLSRGLGGGSVDVSKGGGKRKGKGKKKMDLDLDGTVGGKVQLKGDETERVVVQLLLQNLLKESYHHTAYQVITYLAPGPMSMRLARFASQEAVRTNTAVRLQVVFPKTTKKARASKGGRASGVGTGKTIGEFVGARRLGSGGAKRKRNQVVEEDEDEGGDLADYEVIDGDDEPGPSTRRAGKSRQNQNEDLEDEGFVVPDDDDDSSGYEPGPSSRRMFSRNQKSRPDGFDSDEDDPIDDDWSGNLRGAPPVRKKARISLGTVVKEGGKDVLVLSSDGE